MNALVLALLLQQVAVSPRVMVAGAQTYSWKNGTRTFELFPSETLVAEYHPVEASVTAIEPTAILLVNRPTMRIWKVQSAVLTLQKLESLRPVFHDVAPETGRLRVPVGLVCGTSRFDAPWLEVLEKSGTKCVPDFWYVPTLR
jgi:hypothetical protein